MTAVHWVVDIETADRRTHNLHCDGAEITETNPADPSHIGIRIHTPATPPPPGSTLTNEGAGQLTIPLSAGGSRHHAGGRAATWHWADECPRPNGATA